MNLSTDLLLIRHGETAWNAAQRLQGWANIDLNEAGHHQAQVLAHYLQRHHLAKLEQSEQRALGHIYTSDLNRAIQTAEPLASALNLPIHQTPGLRERNYGKLEGVNWREALKPVAGQPPIPHNFEPHYEAETIEDLSERLQRSIERITYAHAGEVVLVISHGGAIDMLWRYFEQLPLNAPRKFTQRNTTINHIRGHFAAPTQTIQWEIVEWAHQQHLPPI